MAERLISLSVPAETCSLKWVRAFFGSVVTDLGLTDGDRLVLALDEACANLLRHRCASIDDGRLDVRFGLDGELLRVRVGRFCVAGDVDKIRPRDLEDVRPGGLGTSFIEQIMDRVVFEPEPDGAGSMALLMEKRIGARDGDPAGED